METMSEKTKIRLQIILLYKLGTIDLKEDEKCKSSLVKLLTTEYKKCHQIVSRHIPDAEIIEGFMLPVTELTKKLLATCKNNTADIVFITGDIELAERDRANKEIITISVNHKELSTKLAHLMTGIEKKLEEIMHYRPQCGICNKTLVINLFDTLVDKEECFAAISDVLIPIATYLIHESENQYSFPEQEKDKIASKNLEQFPSSSTSSQLLFTEDINDNANNCHKGLFPMISIQSALRILEEVADEDLNQRNSELVKINDAYGRILWEDVYSKCNVPPFRTSSKHGYAVLVKDGKGLRKVQKEENQFPPIPLQPGTCVWVNSGAPIPERATAVVPVKDTKLLEVIRFSNDDSKCIEIMIKPLHGQNIKTVGYDMMKDKIIIKKFTRIGSEEIGLLAGSGCKEVVVVKQLSIGVLSIGENLEEVGKPLKPGFTYDINKITLISLLKYNNYLSLDFGIVCDKVSFIKEKIDGILRIVDVLVTTGCVNDKDLLKNILMKDFEAKIHFGNINVKPGKSTTLASCKFKDKTKYFVCLSGNPTSAYIAAHLILLPFLNRLHRNIFSVPAVISVKTADSFLLHQRPRLALTCLQWSDNKKLIARAFNMSNLYEGRLCDIVGTNALLILPKKKQDIIRLPENSNVPALLIDYPRDFSII